jgi:hypothetical protein
VTVADSFTLVFVVLLSVWPLLAASILAGRSPVPSSVWAGAVGVVVLTQAAFWYAWVRCSTEALSYWQGLRIVSGSKSTGWLVSTMVVSWPILLFTFVASVAFALFADVRRKPEEAATRYRRLVSVLYGNRLWK